MLPCNHYIELYDFPQSASRRRTAQTGFVVAFLVGKEARFAFFVTDCRTSEDFSNSALQPGDGRRWGGGAHNVPAACLKGLERVCLPL